MSVAGSARLPLFIVGLLTVINAGIFMRKAHFEYKPYADEQVLYKPAAGTWNRFLTDFSPEGQVSATRFLDSLLKGSDTARLAQVRQLGTFLYQQFGTRLGKPALNVQLSNPWDMYRFFSADSSRKLWCGHLAMMFNYFCLTRGIETRMIEIMKTGDHHVVNECYIPQLQKWVLVDITYNQLLVTNDQQNLLNLAEFRRLQGKDTRLQVQMAHDSTRILRPDTGYYRQYYNPLTPAYYYYTINPEKVYRFPEKVKRYIWPVSWYRIFDTDPKSNVAFYLKQFFFFSWLISLFILGIIVLRNKRFN